MRPEEFDPLHLRTCSIYRQSAPIRINLCNAELYCTSVAVSDLRITMSSLAQLRRIPNLLYQQAKASFGSASTATAAKLQELALEENCILVNENDQSQGNASKRDCHRVDSNGDIRLHRAFSVFLFNSDGEMLLQRRSTHKVSELLFNACQECESVRCVALGIQLFAFSCLAPPNI